MSHGSLNHLPLVQNITDPYTLDLKLPGKESKRQRGRGSDGNKREGSREPCAEEKASVCVQALFSDVLWLVSVSHVKREVQIVVKGSLLMYIDALIVPIQLFLEWHNIENLLF